MKTIYLIVTILTTTLAYGASFNRKVLDNPQDNGGRSPIYSLFGETLSGGRDPEISINFVYSIDPYDVTTRVSGAASLTATNSMAKLSTGASASSSATLISKNDLLYYCGYQSEYALTAIFPTCTTGNISLAGGGDSEGGIYIGCVDSDFVIRHDDGFGTITDVTQATWNRDRALANDNEHGFVLDKSKLNIFRFSFAWFGTAPISVEVYAGIGKGWRTLHVFDYPNTRTTPHLKNPSLPMTVYTSNTSNTTNLDMYTTSWGAWNVGPLQDAGYRAFSTTAEDTILAATESHIASIRVTNTFQSRHNHLPIKLHTVDAASEGNKPVTIRVYRNCTTLTGGAWSAVNSDSSVTEINTTITGFTCNTYELLRPLPLAKSDSGGINFVDQSLRFNPGDSITVTASSAQTSDISASISWLELF